MSVKKKVVNVVSVNVVGNNNRGIGKYCREYILKNSSNLDLKKLDEELKKKFGVGNVENNKGSRMKSIRWYLNDMKSNGLIKFK